MSIGDQPVTVLIFFQGYKNSIGYFWRYEGLDLNIGVVACNVSHPSAVSAFTPCLSDGVTADVVGFQQLDQAVLQDGFANDDDQDGGFYGNGFGRHGELQRTLFPV